MQENEKEQEKETLVLERLSGIEDLVEKKAKIYSRLLMDCALAEDMETLANRHATRKEELACLAQGKTKQAEKRKEKVQTKETDKEEGEEDEA